MKLTKLASLILAGLLTFSPLTSFAATKSSTNNKTVQKTKKATPLATAKKTQALKKVNKTAKTNKASQKAKLANKPTADKTTQKMFGVKGAALKPSKVSEKRYTYREKGKRHSTISKEASRQYSQVGVASYYGGIFHGRKTASGEVFNKHAFTAAHKTLALGSYALVTNLRNGRKVIVKINDRGPFHGNRILDLSQGAAQELHMVAAGTARVKIEAMHVDKDGYISGKAAESLMQLAKRQGLPLKVRGSGTNLAFKADTNSKGKEQAVQNPQKNAKNSNKAEKVQVKSLPLSKPKFAVKVVVANEKAAKKLSTQVKQKAHIVPFGKQYEVVIDTSSSEQSNKLKTQLRKLGYNQIFNYSEK